MSGRIEPALESAAKHAIRLTEGLDRTSMTVLTLGCAFEDRVDLLLEAGFLVAGMDVRADEVSRCRDRVSPAGRRSIELRHDPSWCLPWPDESFDLVIADRLLLDLPAEQLARAIDQIKRVLRLGGIFVGGLAVDADAAGADAPADSARVQRRLRGLELVRVAGHASPVAAEMPARTSVQVVARVPEFTEQHAAAFREICRCQVACDPSSPASLSDLRERILSVLPELGYGVRGGDGGVAGGEGFLIVPRHRYAQWALPLLIHERRAESHPFLQYEIRGGTLTLKVYGPVGADRRAPFVRFEVDCTGGLPAIDQALVRSGVDAVYRGIAVGVHAAERLLRSGDLRHHASTDLPEQAAARLEALLAKAVRRCDLLDVLFRVVRPTTLYTGHDCYDEAVDVNFALGLDVSVMVLPKGKLFQHYGPRAAAGCWMPGGKLFRSHLSQRLAEAVESRWSSIDPAIVEEARALMERRMGSLSALPYMRNVIYRDMDSDTSVGWRNFRDALGVPIYEPGSLGNGERVAWILSLHSFADEAFRWGMDRLWSLYDMFLVAARQVRDAFPSDVVVLRPHPNSMSDLTEPKLIDEVESGSRQNPSTLLDVYLQLRLCQAIAGLGMDCRLSSLQPTGELLEPEHSIAVTRHGSILVEASWIGRTGIFSRVAPYSFLYPEEQQFDDVESLRTAMRVSRERVLAGKVVTPARQDLARYQAILDTPLGIKRASVHGGLRHAESAVHPMRNFDDFRYYGPEAIAETAARLLSCLTAPSEREALQGVLGQTSR